MNTSLEGRTLQDKILGNPVWEETATEELSSYSKAMSSAFLACPISCEDSLSRSTGAEIRAGEHMSGWISAWNIKEYAP